MGLKLTFNQKYIHSNHAPAVSRFPHHDGWHLIPSSGRTPELWVPTLLYCYLITSRMARASPPLLGLIFHEGLVGAAAIPAFLVSVHARTPRSSTRGGDSASGGRSWRLTPHLHPCQEAHSLELRSSPPGPVADPSFIKKELREFSHIHKMTFKRIIIMTVKIRSSDEC